MTSPVVTQDEWISIGAGRYLVMVAMPWGCTERAEVLVSTASAWRLRREASDPSWTPFLVGPVVLAIRFDARAQPHSGRRLAQPQRSVKFPSGCCSAKAR
jgi:hypothetical protein